MSAPELFLSAALRDANSPQHRARNIAVRSLAPAYLREVLNDIPVWGACATDPRGNEILAIYRRWIQTNSTDQEHGWALLGLGKLGEWPLARAAIEHALALDNLEPAAVMVRECAVLAIDELLALISGDSPNTSISPQDSCRNDLYGILVGALSHPQPEVRFQVAETIGQREINCLAKALTEATRREINERVQAGQARALSRFAVQSREISELLVTLAASNERTEAAYAAAIALSSQRLQSPQSAFRLALKHRSQRDEALEALAYAGYDLDDNTLEIVKQIAEQGWIATATRVRAAYCLAALRGSQAVGESWLSRFEASLRPSVRASVAQARSLLRQLAEPPDHVVDQSSNDGSLDA